MQRVMVVGLLGGQANKVERAFPKVKFMFVEMAHKVGIKWKNFDIVVLMTRFISHKYNIDGSGICQVVYCNGSVSRLMAQLEEVVCV